MIPHPLRHARALTLLAVTACGVPPADLRGPTPDDVAGGLLPALQIEGEAPRRFSMEERMRHYAVPGVSVAVMDDGEIAWARAWGTADLETGAPVTPTTLFQAASISKPVAALAALSLVDDGVLALDTPVNDDLTSWKVPENEFTADSAVTLRGILTHSAGLTVWGFPGYRKDERFSATQVIATNAQVLDGEGNTDSVRVYKIPGTSWQYSGGGYTVMEQLVEDATGLAFEEAVRARVLEQAGMRLSTYAQPLPESRWSEAARGHRADGSEVEGEWHTYPEQAAAGLWTTPTELLTLSAHLLGILDGTVSDGVLSGKMLQAMLTPNHPGDERFSNWGLGFGLQGEGDATTFGHGGSNEGFKAQWTVYRNRGQGAAVMTNGDRGAALAAEILRSISAAYGWPGNKPQIRAARRPTPEELAAYAGRYALDGSDLVVTLRAGDGVLEVDVPGQGTSHAHADAEAADTFFDLEDGQELVFERDAAGAIVAVTAGGRTRLARAAEQG